MILLAQDGKTKILAELRGVSLMREQVEVRLESLKREYEKGQLQLQQLQSQVTSLRDTMLRISGAIMVLEELLSSSRPASVSQEQSTERSGSMQVRASAA
jgi:uncharacterized protein (DUF3084 family)